MWHLLIHGHFFKPHIIGQDEFYFDLYDGCERCMEHSDD